MSQYNDFADIKNNVFNHTNFPLSNLSKIIIKDSVK